MHITVTLSADIDVSCKLLCSYEFDSVDFLFVYIIILSFFFCQFVGPSFLPWNSGRGGTGVCWCSRFLADGWCWLLRLVCCWFFSHLPLQLFGNFIMNRSLFGWGMSARWMRLGLYSCGNRNVWVVMGVVKGLWFLYALVPCSRTYCMVLSVLKCVHGFRAHHFFLFYYKRRQKWGFILFLLICK